MLRGEKGPPNKAVCLGMGSGVREHPDKDFGFAGALRQRLRSPRDAGGNQPFRDLSSLGACAARATQQRGLSGGGSGVWEHSDKDVGCAGALRQGFDPRVSISGVPGASHPAGASNQPLRDLSALKVGGLGASVRRFRCFDPRDAGGNQRFQDLSSTQPRGLSGCGSGVWEHSGKDVGRAAGKVSIRGCLSPGCRGQPPREGFEPTAPGLI